MFDKQVFLDAMRERALARLYISVEMSERLDRVGVIFSPAEQIQLDAHRDYNKQIVDRALKLEAEFDEAKENDAFDLQALPPAARALYEALEGDDEKAFELAVDITELDADAILFRTIIIGGSEDERFENITESRDRLARFGLDFAEEKSSALMREEIAHLALTGCMEDGADSKNFRRLESVLGRSLTPFEIDEYLFLYAEPIDIVGFIKKLFRLGGSPFFIRLAAHMLLEWDDEAEEATFDELVALLPD